MSSICTSSIEQLVLKPGVHTPESGEYCAVEAAVCRFNKGTRHSDNANDCNGSRIVAKLMIGLNDRWDSDRRQQLLPFVDRLPNTRGTYEQEQTRVFICADFIIREMLSRILYTNNLPNVAKTLRDLAPITDRRTALEAAANAANVPVYVYRVAVNLAYSGTLYDARHSSYHVDLIATHATDAEALGLLDRLIRVTAP